MHIKHILLLSNKADFLSVTYVFKIILNVKLIIIFASIYYHCLSQILIV